MRAKTLPLGASAPGRGHNRMNLFSVTDAVRGLTITTETFLTAEVVTKDYLLA